MTYDWKKDGWVKVIVPVQHMFPNCNIRYKTKCTDMKSCDKAVEEIKISFPAKYGDYTLMTGETIKEEKERLKTPQGFADQEIKRTRGY